MAQGKNIMSKKKIIIIGILAVICIFIIYLFSILSKNNKLNEDSNNKSDKILSPTQIKQINVDSSKLLTNEPNIKGKEDQDKYELNEQTDVFLSNKTPYSNDYFSISSDFKPDPDPHFYFLVNFKGEDKEKAKSEFIIWLKSLELDNSQIQNLDIIFQNN